MLSGLIAVAVLQAEFESVEALSPYYKKAAWTSIVIRTRTSGPLEAELVATTDSPVTFVRPVEFEAAGSHTRTLPVYFAGDVASVTVRLESQGRILAQHTLAKMQAVKTIDVIVVAHATTWNKDENWDFGPQRVYGTRFDFSRLEAWNGEALEGIDVLVDFPATGDRLYPWRAMGGQCLAASEFKPESVNPKAIMSPLDAPPPPAMRSWIRRDSALWALLGYGTIALVFFGVLLTRKVPGWVLVGGIPLLSVVFWIAFAAMFPRAPLIVHSQPILISENEDVARAHITTLASPETQTVSLPLGWLTKPLSTVPMRIVLDPSELSVRVERLELKAGAPLIFAGIQSHPEASTGVEFENGVVRAAADPLRHVVVREGDRTSSAMSLAPGASERVRWESEAPRLDEFEYAAARWFCRDGLHVAATLDRERTTTHSPLGTRPVIEWQSAAPHIIRKFR